MAIDSYSDFYATMRWRVAPAPDMLILQAIQYAVRQFCLDSEAYIWETDPYDLSESEFVYTLDSTPTGIYDIVRIKDIRVKTDESVAVASSKGETIWDRGYELLRPNIVQFDTPPVEEDFTDSMYVRLVLAPFEDYTEMDWNFVNRWLEPIRAKALSYLYSQRGRLWFDPDQAERYDQVYRKWVASARRENETEGTSRQLRMTGGDTV